MAAIQWLSFRSELLPELQHAATNFSLRSFWNFADSPSI